MIRDYYEHIEDYLNDSLDEARKDLFEAEMKRDPDLKLVVKHYSTMMDALEVVAQKRVEDALTHIHKNGNGAITKARVPLMRRLYQNVLLRAAAVLLVITSGFLIYANLTHNTSTLAKGAYVSLSDLTLQGTGDTNPISIEVTPDIPLDLRYQYAHELFVRGRYLDAQLQFEIVADTGDPRFAEGAEYFAAICMLLQGNRAQAINELERIGSDPDHNQSQRAEELKEKLTGFWSHFVL